MNDLPDWTPRGDYIASRSVRRPGDTDIQILWANEAYRDPNRIYLNPDPATNSGRSARTIGYSQSAGFIVVVITVVDAGILWGVNAWRANESAIRAYTERDQI